MPRLLLDVAPSQAGIWPCTPGTSLEGEGYRVARVTLNDPFRFLHWLEGRSRSVEAQLSSMLEGRPFTNKLAVAEALSLIEERQFVPRNPGSFVVRIELVHAQNCNPTAKTVDLVYRVYSTAPPRSLGGGAESQAVAKSAPQTVTGLDSAASPVHLVPVGGYNRSWEAFAGGRLEITPRRNRFPLFETLSVVDQGSSSMSSLSLALAGSRQFRAWLNRAAWRIDYRRESAPAGAARLRNAALSAQFSAATRPFWDGAALARFGALLEGGNMQSVVPAALLGPQTVPNAGYGSLKGYAGLSSRTGHNVLSVSYGLELGSIWPAARIDWRKHIGDVADEFWVSIGDHKPLEVESRFTAGGIQVPGEIPLPARFFGGSAGSSFIPGDASWQIRDEPFLRAIPPDRLNLTSAGVGVARFAGLNLTVAYPVKARPMMPRDLSGDKDFNTVLNAQIQTAASVEQNYYSWKDPHFGAAFAGIPDLQHRLDALRQAVDAAQRAHPGRFEDEFSDCLLGIGDAERDAAGALGAAGSKQYGYVVSLLSHDPDLQEIRDGCVSELNGELHDPAVASAALAVESAGAAMLEHFNAIDQKLARRKASADIAFVRRTLSTLFHDLDIFSASPVAVFDAAWVEAAGHNRIGPGAGVRLELASTVNFTLGYAWNIHPQFTEGRGAVFFSINVRDLFH